MSLAAGGCGSSASPGETLHDGPPLPWQRQPFPALVEPADNPTSEAKLVLGELLFYDPILSSDGATACATCHSEVWGLSDGVALSVGVGGEGATGPGRTGPHTTRRNAQTLWNVAYRQALFWDGRSPTLEAQVVEPLTAAVELDREPDALVADLGGIDEYVALFRVAFPQEAQPISLNNVSRALAVVERSFVSDWSLYDRYVAGDERALDARSVQGMFLFAEAGCASCHVPPLFESERYADRGIGDGDDGRYEITADSADRGAFRVPTLRNLRDTEPYFHDGSVQSFEQAVAYEVQRQIDEGLSRPLAPEEVDAIGAFLFEALVDLSREPHRPDAVPSGLPVPSDGFRMPR